MPQRMRPFSNDNLDHTSYKNNLAIIVLEPTLCRSASTIIFAGAHRSIKSSSTEFCIHALQCKTLHVRWRLSVQRRHPNLVVYHFELRLLVNSTLQQMPLVLFNAQDRHLPQCSIDSSSDDNRIRDISTNLKPSTTHTKTSTNSHISQFKQDIRHQ